MSIQRSDIPAAFQPPSRYGICGVGGYKDHNGFLYPMKVIGGEVRFSDTEGEIAIARQPRVNYSAPELATWSEKFHEAVKKVAAKIKLIMGDDTSAAEKRQGVQTSTFANRYELEKLLDAEVWTNITAEVYESFPKEAVYAISNETLEESQFSLRVRHEQFYTMSFVRGQIPSIFTTKEGVDIYIAAPKNTMANLTRILVNKAVWVATCRMLGYKGKTAAYIWKYIFNVFSGSQDKSITAQDVINLLAKKGLNPISSKAIEDNISHFTGIIFMMKIWEINRQNLSLEDWFTNVKWVVKMANTTDQMMVKMINTIYENWQHGQVLVPAGDLPSRADNLIFPVTNTPTSLNDDPTYGAQIFQKPRNTKGQFAKMTKDAQRALSFESAISPEPCVHITEILFDQNIPNYSVLTKPKLFGLVDVKLLNYTPKNNEEYISLNRIYGTYSGVTTEEAAFCISIVYPVELFLRKPDTTGVNYEERHWQLRYVNSQGMRSLIQVETPGERFLYGQKSYLGPNYYLVNSSYWKKSEASFGHVDKDGKKNAVNWSDLDLFSIGA
jgi:hypothetical protein